MLTQVHVKKQTSKIEKNNSQAQASEQNQLSNKNNTVNKITIKPTSRTLPILKIKPYEQREVIQKIVVSNGSSDMIINISKQTKTELSKLSKELNTTPNYIINKIIKNFYEKIYKQNNDILSFLSKPNKECVPFKVHLTKSNFEYLGKMTLAGGNNKEKEFLEFLLPKNIYLGKM